MRLVKECQRYIVHRFLVYRTKMFHFFSKVISSSIHSILQERCVFDLKYLEFRARCATWLHDGRSSIPIHKKLNTVLWTKKTQNDKKIISDKLSVTISYNSDLSPSAKRILFLLRRISTLKYTKAYALYNE